MKHFLSVLSAGVLLSTLGVSTIAPAKEVMGKVLAVYHEPVTVNAKTLDKVSVTVDQCGVSPRKLVTVSYAPGLVSDDNSLGFLFNDLTTAARSAVQKNEYMSSVSGHVSLMVNDKSNLIEKTTFWGYNWECGKNVDGVTTSSGSTSTPAAGSSSAGTAGSPVKPFGRRFGF